MKWGVGRCYPATVVCYTIYISVSFYCLSLYLSVSLSLYLFLIICVSVSFHLPISVSFCLSLSLCLFLYISLSVPFCFFLLQYITHVHLYHLKQYNIEVNLDATDDVISGIDTNEPSPEMLTSVSVSVCLPCFLTCPCLSVRFCDCISFSSYIYITSMILT